MTKKLLLVLALFSGSVFCEDTKPEEPPKQEELDPIIRLRNAYKKNRQEYFQENNLQDPEAEPKKEPSQLYLVTKSFARNVIRL